MISIENFWHISCQSSFWSNLCSLHDPSWSGKCVELTIFNKEQLDLTRCVAGEERTAWPVCPGTDTLSCRGHEKMAEHSILAAGSQSAVSPSDSCLCCLRRPECLDIKTKNVIKLQWRPEIAEFDIAVLCCHHTVDRERWTSGTGQSTQVGGRTETTERSSRVTHHWDWTATSVFGSDPPRPRGELCNWWVVSEFSVSHWRTDRPQRGAARPRTKCPCLTLDSQSPPACHGLNWQDICSLWDLRGLTLLSRSSVTCRLQTVTVWRRQYWYLALREFNVATVNTRCLRSVSHVRLLSGSHRP